MLRSNVILPNAEGISFSNKKVSNRHVILVKAVLVLTWDVVDCLGTCFVGGGFKCTALLVNIRVS